MSFKVCCSVCNKEGLRLSGSYCPKGWLYGNPPSSLKRALGPWVPVVCSEACATAFWSQGPGDLRTSCGVLDDAPQPVGVPDKPTC